MSSLDDLFGFKNLTLSGTENNGNIKIGTATASASTGILLDGANIMPDALLANEKLPKIFGDDIAVHYDSPQVSIGDELEGVVVAGNEWTSFWFRDSSLDDLLRDIEHNLEQMYNSSNDVLSITQIPLTSFGLPCVARYTDNGKWYRARIIDTEYNFVHFVDYGNNQMCNFGNVKPLTRTMAELCPPLAIHCKLADFQNPLLPSFVSGPNDRIRITVHSKHEPFEVSIRMLSQRSIIPGRPPVVAMQQPTNQLNDSRRRVTNNKYLTLPPNYVSNSKFNKLDDDDGDGDEDLKKVSQKAKLTRTSDGKIAVANVLGKVTQMYATCGQITPEGPYRTYILDFNSQETNLNNGSLNVEDLSRIIKLQDRFICNARYEESLPASGDFRKAKAVALGSYQINNLESVSSSHVLIRHATVSLINAKGAQLYIRATKTYVYAPLSTFSSSVRDKFLECVQVGRSVLVRAIRSEKYFDLEINIEWMAVSVELLGVVEEHQGWMYFVRDNYSIVITDGGVGFGYVYVDNNFVNDGGLVKENWYGSRVLYRACLDVPDQDSYRSGGVRMKGLKVTIFPEHSKGAYRYAGIYRPTPIYMSEHGPPKGGRKTVDDDNDDDGDYDLPEEVVQEMALMGKDVIGMNRLRQLVLPKTDLNERTKQLLNERDGVLADFLSHSSVLSIDTPVLEESNVEVFLVNSSNVDINLIELNSTIVDSTNKASQLDIVENVPDLLHLWEGNGELASAQPIIVNGFFDPLSASVPSPLLNYSSAMIDGYVDDDDKPTDRDFGTQVELSMQFAEEIHRLKADPVKFAIVFAEFMKAPPATKNYFLDLLKQSEEN